MIKKQIILLLIIYVISYPQVRLIEDSVYSASINKFCQVNILLPDGYGNGNERYTTIYLLHGFNNDQSSWFTNSHLIGYANSYHFILISAEAKNSWYANSVTQKKSNYEDLIIKDVIPFIDKNYRTSNDREHRAIVGFSMGGYGALKYGLKYPEYFFYAGGLSQSIQFPFGLEDSAIVSRRSSASNKSVREAFGAERNVHWNENDIFTLLERSGKVKLPYFYLSVGSQDGIPEIIYQTHDLAKALRKRSIPFEMHERPGAHEWKLWDEEIENVLRNISTMVKN